MGQNGRGFTLIEMLVVLMVMGLFVGLVSAIMRPDDRAMLQQEAVRLSELLNLAATEAQLNRPHGICVAQDGSIYIGDTENHRVRRVSP